MGRKSWRNRHWALILPEPSAYSMTAPDNSVSCSQ